MGSMQAADSNIRSVSDCSEQELVQSARFLSNGVETLTKAFSER